MQADENRFQWIPRAKKTMPEAIKNLIAYVTKQFSGKRVLRENVGVRGVTDHGSGVEFIDTGDFTRGDDGRFADQHKGCHRQQPHRDYDRGRLTSFTMLLAMQDDVIGIIVNATGEELLIDIKQGHFVIFNTAVIHFGCGKDDMPLDTPRRRLFMYYDVVGADPIRDTEGSVSFLNQFPPPADYMVTVAHATDLKAADTAFMLNIVLGGRSERDYRKNEKGRTRTETNRENPMYSTDKESTAPYKFKTPYRFPRS